MTAKKNTDLAQPADVVRVVGGYAAAPQALRERLEFFRGILADPRVDGLEIPFGSAGYARDASWLWEEVAAGSAHVLTLVAATMESLGERAGYGLASTNEGGRKAALALVARARELVARIAREGRVRIVAVELQSAPGTCGMDVNGSAAALVSSLAEIAGWEWCGAAVALEHCDAQRADGSRAKGFLPLAIELAAVADAGADAPTRLGVSLNWGRSVIERQSTEGAVEHVRLVRDAGLLVGQLFSGACATASSFGPAWSDAHAPMRTVTTEDGEPSSLLGPDEISAARTAAGGGLVFDGVKVSVRPESASTGQRLATVRATLAELASAWPK
jgi:Domain of unknown function (DUF4862)